MMMLSLVTVALVMDSLLVGLHVVRVGGGQDDYPRHWGEGRAAAHADNQGCVSVGRGGPYFRSMTIS